MFKKLKLNGFSLVEVMILFTVLSVILAASVSMITKKTISPSQNKVSHGVYRCIALSNGKYLQETYNGSKRVGRPQEVASCSFRVPKAAMYKVDLYSAGSGGTEQAYISSSMSGSSANASYTLDKMTNATQNQLFIPTDNDLYRYFAGKYYVDSVYTGDAGFGGGIKFTYPSVIDSSCIDGEADKRIIEKRIAELRAELKSYEDIKNDTYGFVDKNIMSWSSKSLDLIKNTGYDYEDYDSIDADRFITQLRLIVPTADDTTIKNYVKNTRSLWYPKYGNYMEYLANTQKVYYRGDWHNIDDWVPSFYPISGNSTVGNYSFAKIYTYDSIVMLFYSEWDEDYFDYSLAYVKNSFYALCDIIYDTLKSHFDDKDFLNYLYQARRSVNKKYEDELQSNYNNGSNFYDDEDNTGEDDLEGLPGNLAWLMRGEHNSATRHKIVGTYDLGGIDESLIWGVRFKDVVDDMLAEPLDKKIADIKAELDRWEKMTDLPQNGYFVSINGSPGAYNERSVLTKQTKQQMFDYCKLMFKPFYEYTTPKRFSTYDTSINTYEKGFNDAVKKYKMTLGGTRMVVKPGGKEGLGRMLVMIYQIGSGNGGGKSFKSYAESIKSTHKPVQCKENNSSECVDFTSIEKGTDANLSSAITYSPGENSIGIKNILNIDYDYDQSKNKKNTSLKIDGSNRYAVTSDGGDLAAVERKITKKVWSIFGWITTTTTEYTKPYVLWLFPDYEGGAAAVTRSLAKGGTGPKVYVDESNTKTYTFPDGYCSKDTWTCPNTDLGPSIIFSANNSTVINWSPQQMAEFSRRGYGPTPDEIAAKLGNNNNNKNFAYTVNADTAVTDGANTVLNGLAKGNRYMILPREEAKMTNVVVTSMNPDEAPFKQEPRLHTQSWIWTKYYKLGASGNTGSLKSTVENDLGDNCTFNVAKPGKKYRPNYDDVNVLNKRLTTSMTCTSRGKKTLYLESPPNTYNTVLRSGSDVQNNSYTWNSGVKENEDSQNVTLKDSAPATSWTPTSMWSRVFNNNVIKNGFYDIKSEYNVGAAGAGTQLKDYCLARKGKYKTSMDYYITYPKNEIKNRVREISSTNCMYVPDSPSCKFSSTFTYSDLNSSSTRAVDIDNSSETKYAPGKYKGFNCYGTNDSNTATTDEMYINADDPIVVNGIMQMSAGDGGGGAVVITW